MITGLGQIIVRVKIKITDMDYKRIITAVISVIVIAASAAGFAYLCLQLNNQQKLISTQMDDLNGSLLAANENIGTLQTKNVGLASDLQQEKDANQNLLESLKSEQDRGIAFQAQIQDISHEVGTLRKLTQTDKELLKKYSKVYFLNENYTPSQLAVVDPKYLLNGKISESIHTNVLPFLEKMLAEANASGVDLKIVSAYRSYADQVSVKTGYKVLYGAGANRFSADQGYSEHQLGTTVDITTPALKGLSLQFEKKPEYQWMLDNAHRFGFTLSYPKNNTSYQFEPWHWRFVGVELATLLHNENKYFYDLTQREIDIYLISIFD